MGCDMEIGVVFAICIITAFLAIILKNYRPEYALVLSVLSASVLLIFLLGDISEGLRLFSNKFAELGLKSSYLAVVMKVLGICVITGFVSDICLEAGQPALANRASFAGRCAVFVISLPLLSSLIDTAIRIIG